MPVKQKAASRRAAAHAADTEGHVNTRLKAVAAKSNKKAAPRAADTAGHASTRTKATTAKAKKAVRAR